MLILYFLIAFFGGVISLFSPCSGALLPTYFTISFKTKNRVLLSNLIFALGVFSVAYPIILGARYAFNLVQNYGVIIFQLLGVIFFVFAILTLFSSLIKFKGLSIDQYLTNKSASFKMIYVVGIVSGLTLGTCIGPILGSIITISATISNSFISFSLVLTYILGMVFPLYLISAGILKLEFLKTFFTKGKLFKINLIGLKFYVHSTNIFIALVYLFLAWIFYLHHGSILSIKLISSTNITEWLFKLQYLLLDLVSKVRP